jgi:hypothetical protein
MRGEVFRSPPVIGLAFDREVLSAVQLDRQSCEPRSRSRRYRARRDAGGGTSGPGTVASAVDARAVARHQWRVPEAARWRASAVSMTYYRKRPREVACLPGCLPHHCAYPRFPASVGYPWRVLPCPRRARVACCSVAPHPNPLPASRGEGAGAWEPLAWGEPLRGSPSPRANVEALANCCGSHRAVESPPKSPWGRGTG